MSDIEGRESPEMYLKAIYLVNKERAQMVYDKFCFWKDVLEKYGLDPKEAENEACKIEHALSDEAFLQIKQATRREEA